MGKFVSHDMFIPYNVPNITEAEIDEVVTTLKPGWLAKGPRTIQLEKQFTEYLDIKYTVATNSCTAVLHMALVAQGTGPGDEVITTPMTYVASANTVAHLGATPVLADIDYRTTCIDPDEIEKKITSRTKAIVPVHHNDQICDLDRIYKVADRYSLFVSEDTAHALWSRYKGRLIGNSLQGAASYSFYVTKNLCVDDGGMLVTDDEETTVKARILSDNGMNQNAWDRYAKGGTWKYDVAEFGYKNNIFDIRAILDLVQLRCLEEMQEAHLEIAARFQGVFGMTDTIERPLAPEYTIHCWHPCVIRIVPEVLTIDRDQFTAEPNERSVGTNVYFIPVHNMSTYTKCFGYKPEDFPKIQKHFERCISLPLYPDLTDEQIQYIIDTVAGIAAKYHK